MPDGGAVWDKIREFIAKLVQSVVQAPAAIVEFVKEHPEEFKTAGLVVLALIAVVVAACVLISIIPLTLVMSAFQLVLASLNVVIQIAVRAVVTPVELVIKVVTALMNALSQAILSRAKFGSGGVRPHFFAARRQSSFYGPSTSGYFSKLKSMSATAGRR